MGLLVGRRDVRFVVAFLMLLLAVGMAAQDSAKQDSQKNDNDQDQSVTTLKVNVNVVNLFFNVKDKHGALIPKLTKDDFEVLVGRVLINPVGVQNSQIGTSATNSFFGGDAQ